MDKRYIVSLYIIYLQTTFSLFAIPPESPENLRVCDKINPSGTDSRPYFGWYVNDSDDNEIQSAVQILVASGMEMLDQNRGDIWDSGKILSRSQNYVYYNGQPLLPAARYYWKVRTWDKKDEAGSWSKPSRFDTGLFKSGDWKGARWIKRNTEEPDDYTCYRKRFHIHEQSIRRAIVYVTAVHKYELYLNGNLIGKGPAYHYPQYQYYNAFDITNELKSGTDNVFACLTHWFGGGQGRPKSSRGFLLKAVIEYENHPCDIIGTDSTWKQIRAEAFVPGQPRRNGEGIGYIEKIDGSKIISDWMMIDYNDLSWSSADEIGPLPVSPWIRDLQPDLTRVIEKTIKPKSVMDMGNGTFVIDYGKICAGTPRIVFSAGDTDAVISMRGGFVLNEDGTVSAEITQDTNMEYYFIPGRGETVFQPVEYLGMRYFQVENSPCPLTDENVSFICRHYEMDESRSSFVSSDSTLNQVWNLMKYSIIAGSQEQFVDTPTREKGGFLGDSWSQSVPAMSVMGDRAMTLRVLLEFLDSQDQYWPDGRLNAVYPNGDGRRDIPDYTQSYLVWIWDYYMQTGHTEFLDENYPRLKKIADYVYEYRDNKTGLIHNLAGGRGPYEYGIIDWPAQMRYGYDMSVETRTVVNVYAYMDFMTISKIAGILGNDEDRQIYENRALKIKDAINSQLINNDGIYTDGLHSDFSQSSHVSQHANMFPVCAQIVPERYLNQVADAIKERKMSAGMVTLRWLPESIGKLREGIHLLDLYTNPQWDGWAQTIQNGGTVTWESWDAIDHDQSLSHPWGAVGLLGIQQYILGVKPLLPQHEKIQIKPLDFKGRLVFAKGTLPTDRGDIVVEWHHSDNHYSMNIKIPDNMTADIYIPAEGNKSRQIRINGKNKQVKTAGTYLLLKNIGSGHYTIEKE